MLYLPLSRWFVRILRGRRGFDRRLVWQTRSVATLLFLPGSDSEDMLAAPGGVGFVDFKIRAGACPPVTFLLDEVDVRRAVNRVDSEPFLGFGNYEGPVFGSFRADLKLCGSWRPPLVAVIVVPNEPLSA